MAVPRAKIEDNLRRIREDIAGACARSGRSQREVSILAVTKGVDVETVRLLPELGLTDLAESRVPQLIERAEELAPWFAARAAAYPAPVRWHMIGHLQRNKVKAVLAAAEVIHSVDSLRLVEDISARAEAAARTVDVLIEVNCSQESQKFGLAVGAVPHMAALIATMKNVRLLGLMTMAPRVTEMEQARATFTRLREIFDEMRRDNIGGPHFRHLSMGMSQDYPVAVEEGATMLRIGTALFE